jgi:hypothetical protein
MSSSDSYTYIDLGSKVLLESRFIYPSHERNNTPFVSLYNRNKNIFSGIYRCPTVMLPYYKNFSLHYRVQNGSGAHPASYPMGIRDSFSGGKAAGA